MYALFLALAVALFGFVAWRDRPLAIAVLAAALPTYLLRFTLAGIPLTLLEALILALTAAWLAKGEWKEVKKIPRAWLVASGAMLAVAIVAAAVNPDHRASLGLLKAYFVEPILLFLVAVTTLKTEKQKSDVLLAFGLGAAFASLVGVFQYATDLGIPAPWDVEQRVTGPFPYPNALGLYAGPAATIALFRVADLIRHHRSATKQIAWWNAIALLCLAGVALAQTEAAYVAILGTLFLASLFSRGERRVTVPAAAVLAVILALTPLGKVVIQKLTFNDYSGQVRQGQWGETWNLLKDHPMFGAGLGGYPTALVPYHTHVADEIFQDPHTLVFNVWVELGLPGLAAFALLAWTTVRTVWDKRKESDRILAFAAFAALAEMSIHGLADVPYFKNDLSALTWLLLAIVCLSAVPRSTIHAPRYD